MIAMYLSVLASSKLWMTRSPYEKSWYSVIVRPNLLCTVWDERSLAACGTYTNLPETQMGTILLSNFPFVQIWVYYNSHECNGDLYTYMTTRKICPIYECEIKQ